MMFYLLRANSLPDLTDVSGRMDQMTHFISWHCFFVQVDI
jgi:hypothetical protein